MKSKIDSVKFNERLNYSTRPGDAFYWGPIAFLRLFFNQSTETFYGSFAPGWFQLTNNNFNRVPFVIDGTYTKNENSETVIEYEVKANNYGFFWIHSITILIMAMNVPAIFAARSPRMIINIVIVLIFMLRYLAIYHKKRELEKNFIEIFEITHK